MGRRHVGDHIPDTLTPPPRLVVTSSSSALSKEALLHVETCTYDVYVYLGQIMLYVFLYHESPARASPLAVWCAMKTINCSTEALSFSYKCPRFTSGGPAPGFCCVARIFLISPTTPQQPQRRISNSRTNSAHFARLGTLLESQGRHRRRRLN